MDVAVIGLGYVGLVTAGGLAAWGHRVTGVDASSRRLDALAGGSLPFFEPGLSDLVATAVPEGRLAFTASTEEAVIGADIVVTAVGTHDGNGGWQTATMDTCLIQVVPHLRDDAVLVVRSTLPPEYVRSLGSHVARLRAEVGKPMIPVLLNPEFTREGQAIADFMEPDRLVLGVVADQDGRGEARLRELYALVDAPVLVMPAIDAAFAKLGSNLFLATKISFANELARLCDAGGARIDHVVQAMAHDARIGGAFLRPGVGFGGSCLPHQVSMTVKAAEIASVPAPLLTAVWEVNRSQRTMFVDRLGDLLGGLSGRRIGLLGLTFKPDTDDLRDAPSLSIARGLIEAGATVTAYDPMPAARARAAEMVPGLRIVGSANEALDGADAAALVTEWPEFAELDWVGLHGRMRSHVVLDGRNALYPEQVTAAGFQYAAFGRGVTATFEAHEPVAVKIEDMDIDGAVVDSPVPSYSGG